MGEVQKASENAVRELFKKMVREKGQTVFETEDFMDDGSCIHLKITIDPSTGSADFDFTGTSPQAYGRELKYARYTMADILCRKLERPKSHIQRRNHIHSPLSRRRRHPLKPGLSPPCQHHDPRWESPRTNKGGGRGSRKRTHQSTPRRHYSQGLRSLCRE